MVKKITLRLPDDLHDALVRQAKADKRSLHSEMLWMFEDVLQRLQPRPTAEAVTVKPREPRHAGGNGATAIDRKG